MRILQLCKKFPYPLKDGESIAVTYLSKALRDLGCEITLLCMNTTKHYTDPSKLPDDFDHYESIHCTPLDNSINAVDAFLNLFSVSSYHVERFVSAPFRDKLVQLLQRNTYDIIQLETLYLAPYVSTIKRYSDAHVVMRAHNVEHEIWERISQNTRFLPKKWYLTHLARKLKNYEVGSLNDYDFLLALTDRDLRKFKTLGYKNGAIASPIGLETGQYVVRPPSKPLKHPLSLCFIGSLDWMPNREGLSWFFAQSVACTVSETSTGNTPCGRAEYAIGAIQHFYQECRDSWRSARCIGIYQPLRYYGCAVILWKRDAGKNPRRTGAGQGGDLHFTGQRRY